MEILELMINGWIMIMSYVEIGLTLATSWEGWRDMLIPVAFYIGFPLACIVGSVAID